MSKKNKLIVDLELLVDLTQATQVLFDIVKDKDLSDFEIERLMYVQKLIESGNNLMEKAINARYNDN